MLGGQYCAYPREIQYELRTGVIGSPCFDQDWNLIALHSLCWDPNFAFEFNEGIPIDPIVASLKNKGIIP